MLRGSVYRILALVGYRASERGESDMQQESFRLSPGEPLNASSL